MKNKSLMSKFSELSPKTSANLESEKKLLPRLKFMGYMMLVFCLLTFAFALTIKKEIEVISAPLHENFAESRSITEISGLELLPEEGELELNPLEVLNFYIIAFTFALVGLTCLLVAWEKRKKLFHNPP